MCALKISATMNEHFCKCTSEMGAVLILWHCAMWFHRNTRIKFPFCRGMSDLILILLMMESSHSCYHISVVGKTTVTMHGPPFHGRWTSHMGDKAHTWLFLELFFCSSLILGSPLLSLDLNFNKSSPLALP